MGSRPGGFALQLQRRCGQRHHRPSGLYALAERTAAAHGTGLQHYVCYASLGDNAYSQLTGDGPACIEVGRRCAMRTPPPGGGSGRYRKPSLLVSEMVRGMDASFIAGPLYAGLKSACGPAAPVYGRRPFFWLILHQERSAPPAQPGALGVATAPGWPPARGPESRARRGGPKLLSSPAKERIGCPPACQPRAW